MEEGKLNIIETGVQPRPLVSITSSLPTISFHDEHGEIFASFEVNKEGKLEKRRVLYTVAFLLTKRLPFPVSFGVIWVQLAWKIHTEWT